MGGFSQGGVAVQPTRRAAGLVLLGAAILAAQNGILLAALLVALAIDIPAGFQWATVALLLDTPGIALLGVGLSRMASRAGAGPLASGLCFAWVGLTIGWRWILPGIAGRGFDEILIDLWGSDGAEPADRIPATPLQIGMLALWMAASAILVAVPLWLRGKAGWPVGASLLEDRIDSRSWEGFVTLNATGTFLVAGSLLAILGGATIGWPLQAGVVIKVALAPSSGAFAYASLARRARKAVPVREEFAAPVEGHAPLDSATDGPDED